MVVEYCGNGKDLSLMARWCSRCVIGRSAVKGSLVVDCFLWVQNRSEGGDGGGAKQQLK